MIFKNNLFQNKKFLITGASSGIGASIALTLNALGAKVIAIARDEKKLQFQQEQAVNSDKFIYLNKDLANYEHLDAWILNICKDFGGFDGAVLSAGISMDSSIRTSNYIQQAKKVFDINYFGNLQVLKGMLDRRASCNKGASFVWIASMAAHKPEKGLSLYSGSKAAVVATMKSIAKEIAPKFRINTISPAAVDTPMLNASIKKNGGNLNLLNSNYPLGLGKAQDISFLACFLLSQGSSWMTGQDIIINGGKA